jgi:hypothetical protein
MHRIALGLTVSLLSLYSPLAAQSADTSTPTALRVRIHRAGVTAPLIGGLVGSDQDSLYIDQADGMVAVARRDVTKFEVSRGMHSNAGRGFGIGLATGAALGLVKGISIAANPDGCFCDPSPGTIAAVAGVMALPGALLGAAIGALSRSERWQKPNAGEERFSLYMAPRRGRTVVALGMTF